MPSTCTVTAAIYPSQESFSVYLMLKPDGEEGWKPNPSVDTLQYPVSSGEDITWKRNFVSLPLLESPEKCQV